MSAFTYNILHIFGALLALFAVGGLTLRAMDADEPGEKTPARKLGGITHGIALLILLVSGFGSLHKLGYGFEPWVWLKIAIWLIFGGVLVVIHKKPALLKPLWFLLPLLAGLAGWVALAKPF